MPKIIDDSAAADLAYSLKQKFRGVKHAYPIHAHH